MVDPSDAGTLLGLMLRRRSSARLQAPAPDAAQLHLILRAATTVPDHGSLHPYRFVVVTEEGRASFGDALAAALTEAVPDVPDEKVEKTRAKAFVAPLQIVLICSLRGDRIPAWEQQASAACCGYAMVLAASALGLGAMWKSAGILDGADLRSLLGLTAQEQVLGWVNVGTPVAGADLGVERAEPDLASLASVVDATGRRGYLT